MSTQNTTKIVNTYNLSRFWDNAYNYLGGRTTRKISIEGDETPYRTNENIQTIIRPFLDDSLNFVKSGVSLDDWLEQLVYAITDYTISWNPIKFENNVNYVDDTFKIYGTGFKTTNFSTDDETPSAPDLIDNIITLIQPLKYTFTDNDGEFGDPGKTYTARLFSMYTDAESYKTACEIVSGSYMPQTTYYGFFKKFTDTDNISPFNISYNTTNNKFYRSTNGVKYNDKANVFYTGKKGDYDANTSTYKLKEITSYNSTKLSEVIGEPVKSKGYNCWDGLSSFANYIEAYKANNTKGFLDINTELRFRLSLSIGKHTESDLSKSNNQYYLLLTSNDKLEDDEYTKCGTNWDGSDNIVPLFRCTCPYASTTGTVKYNYNFTQSGPSIYCDILNISDEDLYDYPVLLPANSRDKCLYDPNKHADTLQNIILINRDNILKETDLNNIANKSGLTYDIAKSKFKKDFGFIKSTDNVFGGTDNKLLTSTTRELLNSYSTYNYKIFTFSTEYDINFNSGNNDDEDNVSSPQKRQVFLYKSPLADINNETANSEFTSLMSTANKNAISASNTNVNNNSDSYKLLEISNKQNTVVDNIAVTANFTSDEKLSDGNKKYTVTENTDLIAGNRTLTSFLTSDRYNTDGSIKVGPKSVFHIAVPLDDKGKPIYDFIYGRKLTFDSGVPKDNPKKYSLDPNTTIFPPVAEYTTEATSDHIKNSYKFSEYLKTDTVQIGEKTAYKVKPKIFEYTVDDKFTQNFMVFGYINTTSSDQYFYNICGYKRAKSPSLHIPIDNFVDEDGNSADISLDINIYDPNITPVYTIEQVKTWLTNGIANDNFDINELYSTTSII